jgi:Arc/MetJ family transcription regulator
MPTSLTIDDRLLEEASKVGGHRTKGRTVNEARREYVRHRKRLCALEAFGTIAMDPDYNDKKLRRRR